MGALFLGQRRGSEGFSRHVAVKVIHGHLATDASFIRMFIDEASLVSKIDDPNVVHVEDFGRDGDTYYLVMEYVHGFSLAQIIHVLKREKRALSVDVVAYLIAAIAGGLHAAHESTDEHGNALGVVHRDVSPHNVLLSTRGHVKLIDFGVAKIANGGSGATATGSLKGKIAYMAPEQAFGKALDRRADVYSLGVLAWELLAARRLFEADNDLALLELVRNPDVPMLRSVRPDVPSEFENALRMALHPNVESRTATAEAFRRAVLKAVPRAATLDPSEIAALMYALMGAPPVPALAVPVPFDQCENEETTTAAIEQFTVDEPETTIAVETMPFDTTMTRRSRLPSAALYGLVGALLVAGVVTLAVRAPTPVAPLLADLPQSESEPAEPEPESVPVPPASSAPAQPARAAELPLPAATASAARAKAPSVRPRPARPASSVRVIGRTPLVNY